MDIDRHPRTLADFTVKGKTMLVVISIVSVSLIVDTSYSRISGVVISSLDVDRVVPVFIIVVIAYAVGQYIVLEFIKQKIKQIRSTEILHLNLIHKIVMLVQYVLTAIIVFTIFQIILISQYNISLLSTAMTISYTLAISILVLLAGRFFSWFRINKNSAVLFYGLAASMIAINAGLNLALVNAILQDRPGIAIPHTGTSGYSFLPGSALWMLNYAYTTSSIVSFLLTWVSTALLLRHDSDRLGKVRYWIVVGIPLAYFLSQFFTLFLNLFAPLVNLDPAFYVVLLTLIFVVSKPAGGILFGVAFWTVARKISQTSIVRDYMIISAYGLVLLFISNQSVAVSDAFYPPFGLATVSLMGLAAYLVLVGIYSSAISVSEDSKLRQSIRHFALRESKLLDSIGTAQMEQEIQKKVLALTKQNQDTMAEETGIQPSLTDEDVKAYLEQVINEVKKQKKRNDGNDA